MYIKAVKDIDINGPNKGVYIFGSEGATGKTFMGSILISLQEIGHSYAVVTYKDNKVVTYGDLSKAVLVFFDRLDLYINDKIVKKIQNIGKNALVLADLKQFGKFSGSFGRANIMLKEESIDIRLWG